MKVSSILKGPRRVRRVAHIARKGASHGLGFFVSRLNLQKHLPAWLRLPSLAGAQRPEDLAQRFAKVLEELGPTFVKFGQMLSTRPDVLPPEYIHELKRICHHVAPFPTSAARNAITEELGRPVDELFRHFEDEPRASGSIAQIHNAQLQDGTPVVVKIRRPRIERTIEDDVAILTFLAEQADRVEEFQPFRLPMLVEEFGRGIRRELDLLAEAAHTHKFRKLFADEQRIEIPRIYWEYTTERVLTMRRIDGTHLDELLPEGRPPVDRGELARTIMDAYLRQFFVMGTFHGDPHPGNIVVTPQGTVGLLDFGLVGRVNPRLRRNLGVCLMALGNDQFELIAEVMGELGQLPYDAHYEEFQEELVSLLDRYSSVPLEKLDFQQSFNDTMGVVRKYRVDIPRDFVLMGRALVVISGVVTQLDPGLNVAELARPYGRKLLRQKLAPLSIKRSLTAGGYHLSGLLSEAPRQLRRLLRSVGRGLFEVTIKHEGFEKGLRELDQTGNRLALSIILAAVIMASSSLLSAGVGAVNIFGWDVSLLGLLGLLFGMILGVWLIFGILRSGRI
ncbi:MAG: AarF/ABC1/UbiB kinase family protein [Candidatus Brocadiia bacterium]